MNKTRVDVLIVYCRPMKNTACQYTLKTAE